MYYETREALTYQSQFLYCALSKSLSDLPSCLFAESPLFLMLCGVNRLTAISFSEIFTLFLCALMFLPWVLGPLKLKL